ncbi:MAG TPA: D-aminoacyl-tRNA deacylase [Syntrophales bacterium]|jgi:D-tyrosyl-tRNA(Tyr) deacylase|nr:D-aminoacyl-tRNA deacylase [Syntrophales bacterium]HPC31400.1 D-aminoacyl-tRNA deacylase [Syntrophales bacterium]HQG33306.1 D-aminoacyl-tRNA deacylase [Syntrophales bacterium]HQI35082.1 D-aminoacyl-tRNA deacylase [Syntrophales bacterium]HQJ29569.1 D-aminoacyl-tRNA deacylase [Syntrophales bacterium]
MRAVVQRVDRAAVTVADREISRTGKGLIVFLGIEKGDGQSDADYLLEKIINLRIFEDTAGKMNLSLDDLGGELMIISQFTLLGDCRKGRRPSFYRAEEPTRAKGLYDYFVSAAAARMKKVGAGEFQAMMKIDLVNDGPVTLVLDSKNIF